MLIFGEGRFECVRVTTCGMRLKNLVLTPPCPVQCGVPRKRPTRIDDVKAWESECPRNFGKPELNLNDLD